MNQSLPKEIFRAYDIRGIVDKQLTPEVFNLLGKAYGSIMDPLQRIVIGYDGRISSQCLAQGLIDGLIATGREVINIGQVPTPCLYYAVTELAVNAGIMVTGSHNPPRYNGCKMMMDGDTLALEQIQLLYETIEKGEFICKHGSYEEVDFLPVYIDALSKDIHLQKQYKVVVDCGNGVAGPCISALLQQLGCSLSELYCEVDGNFPNHHPDPSDPRNLMELQHHIKQEKADLGYAFDGDGDRLGIVDHKGHIIYPDRLLMLFAEDLLLRHPRLKTPIIYDVKCSSLLPELISNWGGQSLMWKTGHSLIKRKMKEAGALLAGEMSGHIFFAENWCGSDDAFLAAVRLLQIIDRLNFSVEEAFARYPIMLSTPEINIPTADEQEKFSIITALSKSQNFKAKNIARIDGLRVEYEQGWGLVRASNTSPVLVLRFEAQDETTLQQIKTIFQRELHSVAPSLQINF